jgi:hypothetical protein
MMMLMVCCKTVHAAGFLWQIMVLNFEPAWTLISPLPPCTLPFQQVEERDGLVQLVNAQAKELDRLKAQVLALRRKDTSVYS